MEMSYYYYNTIFLYNFIRKVQETNLELDMNVEDDMNDTRTIERNVDMLFNAFKDISSKHRKN